MNSAETMAQTLNAYACQKKVVCLAKAAWDGQCVGLFIPDAVNEEMILYHEGTSLDDLAYHIDMLALVLNTDV